MITMMQMCAADTQKRFIVPVSEILSIEELDSSRSYVRLRTAATVIVVGGFEDLTQKLAKVQYGAQRLSRVPR